MIRRIAVFLSFIWIMLLLFQGCSVIPANSKEVTGHIETTETTEVPACKGFPEVVNPGNSLIVYEPELDIYIGCDDSRLDIYNDTSNITWKFDIVSKVPIDTNTFDIQIPIQNQYEVYIHQWDFPKETEYTVEENDSFSSFSFPYELYTVYCGMDYSAIKTLYDTLSRDGWDAESLEQYEDEKNKYRSSFQEITGSDLPVFYIYSVSVIFDTNSKVNESFQKVDFLINGKIYPRVIGEINLINESIPFDYPIGGYGKITLAQTPNLYGNGIGRNINLYRDFKVEQDLILTGFHILGDHTEVLDLYLEITSGGNTVGFSWDGNSEISLFAGDELRIDLIYKREESSGLYYNLQMYTELDCMIDGKLKAIVSEINLNPTGYNPYMLYAIIFDGLDMESYYRDYYYPLVEPWREQYKK